MNSIATGLYLLYICAVLGCLLIQVVNYEHLSLPKRMLFATLILNTTPIHIALMGYSQSRINVVQLFYFDLKLWITILFVSFLCMGFIYLGSERSERFKQFIGLEEN
ncbi:MAG: hypothetical protein ACRCST_06530 [Turicibacter sp.]